MINLEPEHLKIIKDILKKYQVQFYAYGSRVKGTHRRFSDLDLCYKEEIPLNILAEIETQFEESDLPFKVDLVNWSHCSDDFKKLISKYFVKLESTNS